MCELNGPSSSMVLRLALRSSASGAARAWPAAKGDRSMDLASLLISLMSAAVGGSIAGATLRDKSLGALGDSIAGVVGGGLGAALLRAVGMAPSAAGLDLGTLIASAASGGVGGAFLLVIVSLVKGVMARS